MKTKFVILWVAQIVAAAIMFQTLFFKFTAAPESVYIFSTLGMEPIGRIGTGVIELIVSLLLLWPRTAGAAAVIGMGVMGGAIMSHLAVLGIEVQHDGGLLFALALITIVCCGIVAWIRRKDIPILNRFI
jgi:putative oxidoreductase